MKRIAALVLLAVVGCAPAAPSASAPPPAVGEVRSSNQVLRIAKGGLPGSASPESSNLNNDIYSTQFDSVLRFGENFAIQPGVATKWELTPATMTWRLTIRQDLTFSNGDKLTAEDVAYSINNILEKRLPQLATLSLAQKATATDATTVDVVSRGVDPTFLNGLPGVFVLPSKLHAGMAQGDFGTKPVGSGPYEISEYRSADRFVYKPRANYTHPYRKPAMSEVRFQAIPDLAQQINGLRGGELDIIQGAFPVDSVAQVQSGGFKVSIQPSGVSAGLITQPEAEQRQSPLLNLKVRQALNYAVNRKAIADSLFKGFSKPAGQIAIEGAPYYDSKVEPYPYDVAKAKALLAEAGYPTGFKLPLGIEFSPQSSSPDLVATLQGALRDAGVESPATQFEQAQFTQRALVLGQPRGDILMLNVADANGTFSQLPNLFDCAKQGFLRWWCSAEFDRLFLASKVEPDATKRADLLRQALNALNAEAPYILTVTVPFFTVNNPKLRGFVWTTRSFYDYDNVYRVE